MTKKTQIIDVEQSGQRKRYSITVETKDPGCLPLVLFICFFIARMAT